MCGIVAYNGKSDHLLNALLSGLKRLEYRGYDSAGVAVITNNGIYTKKTAGKVKLLEQAIEEQPPEGVEETGIAHTRWATHG